MYQIDRLNVDRQVDRNVKGKTVPVLN